MARDFQVPVVPVASSLGLYWRQDQTKKYPGKAVLEFLDPIPADLPRAEFMARLEAAVEDRTAELIAEATGRPVTPAVLGVPEDEAKQLERRRLKDLADEASKSSAER